MAAIIDLTDQQRRQLLKLLNNINPGFVSSGFGEAFIAMLDGTPVTFEAEKRVELVHLINNLNLDTFEIHAGDVLVGLIDSATSIQTAQSLTDAQVEALGNVFQHLNIALSEIGFAELVKTAALALVPSFEWDGAQPKTGKIGTPLTFKWVGGAPKYHVLWLRPDGTEHDRLGPVEDTTYTASSDHQPAGKWKLQVIDNKRQMLEQEVTMTAGVVTPSLSKFTLSGKGVSADTADKTYKVSVNADGSDPVSVTVEKSPAGADWGHIVAPVITAGSEAFVDKTALDWNAVDHTFVVKGKAAGDAVMTIGNGTVTVTLKVNVA